MVDHKNGEFKKLKNTAKKIAQDVSDRCVDSDEKKINSYGHFNWKKEIPNASFPDRKYFLQFLRKVIHESLNAFFTRESMTQQTFPIPVKLVPRLSYG